MGGNIPAVSNKGGGIIPATINSHPWSKYYPFIWHFDLIWYIISNNKTKGLYGNIKRNHKKRNLI